MKVVHLISQENETFEVSFPIAKMFESIRSTVEEDEKFNDNKILEIPVPVKSNILVKVIEFCQHYLMEPLTDIEKPIKSNDMHELVSPWYADFVMMEQQVFFEVLLAAHSLELKPLLDLTCAYISSLLKGKSAEEIRKQYNITNDFTPEEEARIREENKWFEEA